jgi:hypothetical protein
MTDIVDGGLGRLDFLIGSAMGAGIATALSGQPALA